MNLAYTTFRSSYPAMKPASLVLLVGLLAACGCGSRQAQTSAVNDAEKVVAFYLPKLLSDPTLTADAVFKLPANPAPQWAVSQKLRDMRAQESSRFQEQYIATLRTIATQEFRGLKVAGRSFNEPGLINLEACYYLDARRNAVFGQTTIPVSLLVMHPDNYAGYLDHGVEVQNDPQATGVQGVGKLKFLLGGIGLVATNRLQAAGPQAVAEAQFEIRGRLRVFVSHSGVHK